MKIRRNSATEPPKNHSPAASAEASDTPTTAASLSAAAETGATASPTNVSATPDAVEKQRLRQLKHRLLFKYHIKLAAPATATEVSGSATEINKPPAAEPASASASAAKRPRNFGLSLSGLSAAARKAAKAATVDRRRTTPKRPRHFGLSLRGLAVKPPRSKTGTSTGSSNSANRRQPAAKTQPPKRKRRQSNADDVRPASAKRARLNVSDTGAEHPQTMHMTAHRASNTSTSIAEPHSHPASGPRHLQHQYPAPALRHGPYNYRSMDDSQTAALEKRLNGINMNNSSSGSGSYAGLNGGGKSTHLHHQNSLHQQPSVAGYHHSASPFNSSQSAANGSTTPPPPAPLLPPHYAHHLHHHHNNAAPPLPPGKHISAASMATLGNIGNTCYLNSVIYTLRFAPHFLHNLHHLCEDLAQVTQRLNGGTGAVGVGGAGGGPAGSGVPVGKAKSSSLGRNVGGLTGANTRSWSTKDLASMGSSVGGGGAGSGGSSGGSGGSSVGAGSGGGAGVCTLTGSNGAVLTAADLPRTQRQIATERLHDLFNALRRNEVSDAADAFHAGTFLGAVQDVSAIFEGNQQQDAHEFLMCVLDSIRETSQALTKVIGECPEIIMNSAPPVPEKPEPLPIIQNTPSVRISFFRKRKEDKSKANRLDSPSKESAAAAAAAAASAAAAAAASAAAEAAAKAASAPTNDSLTQPANDSSNGSAQPTDTIDGSMSAADKDAKAKLSERIRELGLDFFTEDFEGVTVSSTKCLSCETVTEQKETMIDLSVPITGYESQDMSADQFIQDLCITREHFNSENKYRCEVCTGLTEAIRTVSYPVLPRLLIIQLKRFSGGMEKINSFIPTPFTMQCFCSRCCALPDGAKLHVYRLYSVITHVGATLSVGHYIAYTSALDGYGDCYSCPKVKRKSAQLRQQQQQQLANGGAAAAAAAAAAASASAAATLVTAGVGKAAGIPPVPAPSEKSTGLIKKMIFGRSKASSSGDVTKQMKNALNGLSGSGGGSLKHNNSLSNGGTGSSAGSMANGGGGGHSMAGNGVSGKDAAVAAADAVKAAANAPCSSLTCCGIMTKPIAATAASSGAATSAYHHQNGHTTNGSGAFDAPSTGQPPVPSSKSSSLYSSNSTASEYYSATSTANGTSASAADQLLADGGPAQTSNGATNGLGGGTRKPQHAPPPPPPPPPPADSTWYMCDDDKIKAMSQREFEELLSPNSKKIMITPYLLFYARANLQP